MMYIVVGGMAGIAVVFVLVVTCESVMIPFEPSCAGKMAIPLRIADVRKPATETKFMVMLST